MTGNDGLRVHGGSAGFGADLDNMTASARQMDLVGRELQACAHRIARRGADTAFAAAAVLCPDGVARAEQAIAASSIGPAGALPTGTAISLRSRTLELTATAYRRIDTLTRAGLESLSHQKATLIGTTLPPLAIALTGIALTSIPGITSAAAFGTYWLTHPDQAATLAKTQLHNLSTNIQDYYFDHPEALDETLRDTPWLIQGALLTTGPPAIIVTGARWPTQNYETLLEGLIAAGNRTDHLNDDGGFTIQEDKDFEDRGQRSGNESKRVPPPPENLSELIGIQVYTYSHTFDDLPENHGPDGKLKPGYADPNGAPRSQAAINITTDEGPPRRHIVTIPGTEDWSLKRGTNPADLGSNLHLMGGHQVELQRQVNAAMEAAGIQADEEVMLSGHSQGGIAAASLAADEEFNKSYTVKSVVATGAPIARFPIPPSVDVLAIEHDSDAVPKLDGRENPDRSRWTTVKSDLHGRIPADEKNKVFASHSSSVYQETGGILDSRRTGSEADRSFTDWRDRNAGFFTGKGTHRVYRIVPGQ